MLEGRHLSAAALCLLASACFTRSIAERAGVSGWFYIDEQQGFVPLAVADADKPCADLAALQHDLTKPILVLVHGVNGDGDEWSRGALPVLLNMPPAATFMLRWVPYDDRADIAQRLAAGVSNLARCLPGAPGRLIVLAHSAGGVVTSFAVSRFVGPPHAVDPWVTVLTVASPLAGTVGRKANANGAPEATMMLDLGTAITAYPAAAAGVRVLHLRTQLPGDTVMKPFLGHVPNDPVVGVPGALRVDLPDTLDHNGSLTYVAQHIADGTWTQWLAPPPP